MLNGAGLEHFLRTGTEASVSLFALGVLQSVLSVWKEMDLLTCERIKHLSAPKRLVFRWQIHPWEETVNLYKLVRNKSPGFSNILMWVKSVFFFSNETYFISQRHLPLYLTCRLIRLQRCKFHTGVRNLQLKSYFNELPLVGPPKFSKQQNI